jgi:hypothetical protein
MNAGGVAGLYGIANAQNAASVGDLVGTEGDAQVLGADSSAYSATGVNAKVQLFSGGAVDNAYALRANIDAGVGGGSVTNGYGIWVYDMTAAANNWAIKTGAGTVEFGDLTSAPVFQGNSAAPSISGCGAMIAAASNNSAGMITAGTAAPCTITLTFTQPYAHGTFCNAVDQTTPAVFTQTAQSASSVTLKAASSTASDTIVYGCTPGY